MTDAVKAAIEAAKSKATDAVAAAPPPASASTEIIPTASNAIANVGPRAPALSMDTLGAGQMSIDKWIKVNEHGITFGDSPILVQDPVKVTLHMVEGRGFIPKRSIKGGNPAQYASTLNDVDAVGGGSWADAIKRIQALGGAKVPSPYSCVDLPMTLVADLKVKKGNEPEVTLAKAGDVLGYSTSTTNWGNWTTFYNSVKDKGLLGKTVELTISSQYKKNTSGNVWGVVKFELIGESEEAGE